MSHSDMQRAWAAAGLAAALIATTMSTSIGFAASGVDQQRARTPTPTPPANLLRNGGFEGEYVRQWNAANTEWANGRVAEGWLAWWRKPTAPDGKYPGRCPDGDSVCQAWHRPEYRQTKGIPYTPPRIRGGDNSQMYFTSFGVHEGGLYQKAGGVPKGWRVRFSIWARVWSSDTEDTTQSSGQPSLRLRVGIDPTGGVDPWSADIIWSEESDSFDEFGQLSVEAVSRADTLTVFFRSLPARPLKHVDVVVDDAELIPIGPPPPTPVIIESPNRAAGAPAQGTPAGPIVVHVVQPGDTLFALAQAYGADLSAIYALNGLDETSTLKVGQSIQIPLPVAEPPEAAPTPAPPTPQPAAMGTLCVDAFVDASGDGRYNEGDARLPGAAFTVADTAGRMVATTSAAQCFADLPVGAYIVSAQLPAGYLATSDTRWGVALTEDARVAVAVGGRSVDESGKTDTPGSPAIAIGGGSIIILAAAIALVRRARSRNSMRRE